AQLPVGFDAWFACCLERDPVRRFPTAREAIDALVPLLGAASSAGRAEARSIPNTLAPPSAPRRRTWLVAAAALAIIPLVGGGAAVGWGMWDASRDDEEEPPTRTVVMVVPVVRDAGMTHLAPMVPISQVMAPVLGAANGAAPPVGASPTGPPFFGA